MSSCGIHGVLTDGVNRRDPCLLIGSDVPRVHHSDGIPVYLVIESDEGIPILGKDKRLRNLLAYPSQLPAPAAYNPNTGTYALLVNSNAEKSRGLKPAARNKDFGAQKR